MKWLGPVVLAWLSGMFTAIWASASSEPQIGPITAGVFAVITGVVTVWFGIAFSEPGVA